VGKEPAALVLFEAPFLTAACVMPQKKIKPISGEQLREKKAKRLARKLVGTVPPSRAIQPKKDRKEKYKKPLSVSEPEA
jgi:hypothetical protein